MSGVLQPLTPAELENWRRYIGRTSFHEQFLDVESLRRYAVAVGSTPEVEKSQPPIAHWAYFSDAVAQSQLGLDGHPQRGVGLIPPIRLKRRMFAASSIRYSKPLELNQHARLKLEIIGLNHKAGSSGDLVFVELQRTFTQHGRERITEQQTIVYLESSGAGTGVVSHTPTAEPPDADLWEPNAVEVFRFSAATFNAHRIHYDLPYAQGVEGYSNLVVQGPLTAAKLHAFAQSCSPKPMTSFAFRTRAPLFINQPVRLRRNPGDHSFEAVRCDGVVAVTAQATS